MKIQTISRWILGLLLAGGGLLLATPGWAEPVKLSGKKWVLIDVRDEDEFKQGHLPGAILIPYSTIDQQIDKVVPNKEAPILLYCASGMRSEAALEVLTRMGYSGAVNGGSQEDLRKAFQK